MLNLLFIASIANAYIKIPLTALTIPSPISLSNQHPLLESSIIMPAIENYMNLQYTAIFNIGTPPQSMSLFLDTGSSLS